MFIPQLTRFARNICHERENSGSGSIIKHPLAFLRNAANEQNFSRFCPRAWHPATRVVFSIYCRDEYGVSREDEETKESHAGGRGRCFKRRVSHPPFPPPRRGLESTETLFPSGRSAIERKKKGSRGRSCENFLSGSFVTRTLFYIHEGFVSGGGGRWKKEGRHWLGVLTTDADRSSRAKTLARAGKEIFFQIAHPSQSDSLAWIAFNTSEERHDCNDVRPNLKLHDWSIWNMYVRIR